MSRLAIAVVLFALAEQSEPPRAVLELAGVRALDDGDRTTLLLVVRNPGGSAVTIRDLALGGQPLSALLVPSDPKSPRSLGKGADWFDLRPRTIPPRGAGAILLGSVPRELREPRLALTAFTDRGDIEFACASPRPESLRVATAAFSADLKTLTVYVRNDGSQRVTIRTVEFNGTAVTPAMRGGSIAPGMLGVIEVRTDAALGAPCTLRVLADVGSATTSFRAYPAESVNYPFYGQHADRRDLAEKNMDVYVTRQEAGVHAVEEVDRNGGRMPDAMTRRLTRSAESFGKSSQSWAWYMEDDAGWGRPRPQSLIDVGRFLRERGSPQAQFVCNPADLRRYAWTHDFYMNYEYHVTGQAADPTIFSGERSLDAIRELNEPAPILYLVDAVGQSVRWITPAEEELASYAMLGRGARHFGWFLVPSVWEQGSGLGGGIDTLERRPQRYQEGATACVQVWNQIGNIAAVTKALQPFVATSAKLPSHLRDDRIEVLPLLCKDDLIVTTLLNRRLRCSYPRDGVDGMSSGGLQLKPHRDVAVSHRIPEWIHPARVVGFDHDRGFRDLTFTEKDHVVTVTVDALDTVTLLFITAAPAQGEAIRQEVMSRFKPSGGGSAIRPELALDPGPRPARTWHDSEKNYRATLTVENATGAGTWIQGALPVEGAALGFFDPRTVSAFHRGKPVPVRVDYFHPVVRASEGVGPWSLGKDDPHASIEAEAGGICVTSHWKTGYGMLQLRTPLDPAYDVVEIQRSLDGRLEPLLPGISLRRAMDETVFGQSETVAPTNGGRLAVSRIRWRSMIEAKGGKVPDAPRFSAQLYDGVYRFGEIRQCRSKPLVSVAPPAEAKPGERCEIEVYWNYGASPCAETPAISDVDRVASAVPAAVGRVDGFQIVSADEKSLLSEARLDAAWIEGRDPSGALTFSENLRSGDGRRWSRAGTRTAERLTLYGAGSAGRVVSWSLRTLPVPPALSLLAQASGQIESLACSEDGRLVVAGADRVRAYNDVGREQWTVDLGDHRRQQERYGPGRNVDRVEIQDAERKVFARTFRWNEKSRQYEDPLAVAVSFEGKELSRGSYDWKSLVDVPKGPAAWPPYTHIAFRLKSGSWIAATTQGRIQLLRPDGSPGWEVRRPSRIDAAVLLEDEGRLAIAYKSYPHRWDWTFAPTIELLSLEDGRSLRRAEGLAADDRGHLGTDLCLARGRASSTLYLGDCRGRIFVFDPARTK